MAQNQNLLPEYTSITGAWVLDLARSDTFEEYLRCLGTPDAAIHAQIVGPANLVASNSKGTLTKITPHRAKPIKEVAGERAYQSRHVIALDQVLLVIHKDTVVQRLTDRFELNREHAAPRRNVSGHVSDGADQIIVSLAEGGQLDGYLVATTTAGPSGVPIQESVEVRQLADGGYSHTQEINARNLTTGEQCVVTRTWLRVPMTQEDQLRLAFF